MTTSFENTLAKIKSFDLRSFDEQAVKQGVILPLLNRIGWDTEDMNEVRPELQTKGIKKVDYACIVGGTSRMFVEAKAWSVPLTQAEENQLNEYCRSAKVNHGVLTNGREWRLYLHKPHRKWEQKMFLKVDIVSEEPSSVEDNFIKFLARANLLENQAVNAARDLIRQEEEENVLREVVKDVVDKVTTAELAVFIADKVQNPSGSRPSDEQVEKILSRLGVKVISELPKPGLKKPNPKPASFTFQTGKEKLVVKEVKVWKSVLLGVCELMSERHPDIFKKMPLELPKRFKDSGEGYTQQIGNTGIYVKYVASADVVKKFCPELVAKFGYPKDSLTIEERSST